MSTTISRQEIEDVVEQLKFDRHRESTKNYLQIWRSFNEFFLNLDSKPAEWVDRMTLFAAYLVQSGKQSSTVKCYISAVKAVLQNVGVKLNQDKFLLSAITRGCKLKNDVMKIRLPIHKEMLHIILRFINSVFHHRKEC